MLGEIGPSAEPRLDRPGRRPEAGCGGRPDGAGGGPRAGRRTTPGLGSPQPRAAEQSEDAEGRRNARRVLLGASLGLGLFSGQGTCSGFLAGSRTDLCSLKKKKDDLAVGTETRSRPTFILTASH